MSIRARITKPRITLRPSHPVEAKIAPKDISHQQRTRAFPESWFQLYNNDCQSHALTIIARRAFTISCLSRTRRQVKTHACEISRFDRGNVNVSVFARLFRCGRVIVTSILFTLKYRNYCGSRRRRLYLARRHMFTIISNLCVPKIRS